MHIKRVFCFICCFVKVTLKNKILFSNQESKIFQYLSKGVWWTKTCSNSTIKTLVQCSRHGEKQVKIIIIIKFGTYLYHWIWFIGSIVFDFDTFSPLHWFCIEDRPHPHLHPLLQLTLHSKRNCSLGWLGKIVGVEVKKYKDPNEACKFFLKTFFSVYVNLLPKVKVQVKSKSLHSI